MDESCGSRCELLELVLRYLHDFGNTGKKCTPPRRRTPARRAQFFGPFLTVASFILLALMASSTPTPIYSIYAAEWHFSALVGDRGVRRWLGHWRADCAAPHRRALGSDRPAPGDDHRSAWPLCVPRLSSCSRAASNWLYVARSIQGLATGLLLGATGAALVDPHPRRDRQPRPGSSTASQAPAASGRGALLSGLFAETRASRRSPRTL